MKGTAGRGSTHSQELRSKLKPAEVPQVADMAPYTHSDVEAELLPAMQKLSIPWQGFVHKSTNGSAEVAREGHHQTL